MHFSLMAPALPMSVVGSMPMAPRAQPAKTRACR